MRQQTIDILADLIAFPTVSADSNRAMIDYLAEHLTAAGARVDIMADMTGGKANLFATLGPEGDGGIVLSGHSDVVPAEEPGWTGDPFVMRQSGDKLYGRGTCDMKGYIAATVAMAPIFAEQPLSRPLHFCYTYDEETGCFGALHLADELRRRELNPAMAIIGEPTDMRLIDGHKGGCEYSTHFHGLPGHGAQPDKGVSAIDYATRYISRLLELREELKRRAPEGSRFDPPWTTLQVGRIEGGVARNVIAEQCTVDWEVRPVADADRHFVKQTMNAYAKEVLLPEMQRIHPEAAIDLDIIGEFDVFEPMTENEARDLVRSLTGANGTDVVSFGTEAAIYQKLGMDVIVCGPGSVEQAHKADEYVTLDQLDLCLELLHRLQRHLTQ